MSQDPEAFGRRKPHEKHATLGMREVLGFGHIVGPEARRRSYGDFALRKGNGIEKRHENRNQSKKAEAGDKKPESDSELES